VVVLPLVQGEALLVLEGKKEKNMDDHKKILEESKEAYVRPTLFVHGNVEVITQGSSHGPRHDTPFPGGFKKRDEGYS
jgi:hypothetical protein